MSGYVGDGVPDSGRFQMAPDGSVLTGNSDASMLCIFYKRAVHNAIKSAQEGRPIYEDQDYVRIQQPGETTQVVDRPTQQNDIRRWPQQWQAYAAGKDQVAEGTPLGLSVSASSERDRDVAGDRHHDGRASGQCQRHGNRRDRHERAGLRQLRAEIHQRREQRCGVPPDAVGARTDQTRELSHGQAG